MLKHEAKLINPSAEQIVAALTEATAAANKRCRARLLADDAAKWLKFARSAAGEPEGYALFRGGRGAVPATQLVAAWWTDAAGRKHVVLRGRRVEHDEAKRLLQKDELDTRSPLWHAYPEYVCRRTVGTESQLVCACGCGAVGTPESLGWMGETCGPCFDRKEELGAGALRANLPGVLYGDRAPLGAVACSPDGTRVAAVEGDDTVTVWDIPRRTRTMIKFTNSRITAAPMTSDGRHLLVSGCVGLGGLFAAFDLTVDPPKRANPETPTDINLVSPLPDSDLALATRWTFGGGDLRTEVIRVPSGESVRPSEIPPGHYGRFIFSADGTRLALLQADANSDATVLDPLTLRAVQTIPQVGRYAEFSHDGKRLISVSASLMRAYDTETGRPESRGVTRHGAAANWICALAVDPVGQWVFLGGSAGTVSVVDARSFAFRTAFEWHLGTVRGLAVSADGSRLFSTAGDGCVKVWPIRDLMKGV